MNKKLNINIFFNNNGEYLSDILSQDFIEFLEEYINNSLKKE